MKEIKTYTLQEAEEVLKVRSRCIRAYINEGKLKAAKIGRRWVIKHEDLEDFINKM